jgi:DNA-binding NarL/FixJ family response regulator
MPRTTVLLADEHVIVTDGLFSLLNDRFDVVGAVATGNEMVSEATRLRPDVIVAELSLPELSGLEAMRQLKARRIDAKVVFLTMVGDAEIATEAVRAGASGYVLKYATCGELLKAIDQVLQGHLYLTPLVTKDVLAAVAVPAGVELSARQRDVLRHIVDGRRTKEIAAVLQLSPRTVETHTYELKRVLGLQSTAALVRYALDHKIVA